MYASVCGINANLDASSSSTVKCTSTCYCCSQALPVRKMTRVFCRLQPANSNPIYPLVI